MCPSRPPSHHRQFWRQLRSRSSGRILECTRARFEVPANRAEYLLSRADADERLANRIEWTCVKRGSRSDRYRRRLAGSGPQYRRWWPLHEEKSRGISNGRERSNHSYQLTLLVLITWPGATGHRLGHAIADLLCRKSRREGYLLRYLAPCECRSEFVRKRRFCCRLKPAISVSQRSRQIRCLGIHNH